MKTSKFVLAKNESNLPHKEPKKLEQVKVAAPKLSKIHSLKEVFINFLNKV
ncbi:MAG: transposase [Crinalium sp.]